MRKMDIEAMHCMLPQNVVIMRHLGADVNA